VRRVLQSAGAEVIHLGHNRAVDEIVTAALQEDVQGIALSSYQGGHMEFFKYMLDLLRERGGHEIKVFGGGGGVIVPEEVAELHAYGVARIYTPEDGRHMGLQGMIEDMMARCDFSLSANLPSDFQALSQGNTRDLARVITALQDGALDDSRREELHALAHRRAVVPVLGITGTGGAGKSSLTDELIRRFRMYTNEPRIAIIAIDPSRRKTGGALLGDRIRMNAIEAPNVYMRSIATRDTGQEVPASLTDMITACKAAGFQLVVVETPGIGQGDAGIVPFVDLSLYVMTPEYGAASQLEKIDMLDFADFVAINKFDRKGAEDALRDVRKQYQRNREMFGTPTEEMPVFGTQAARFNDDGITALYQALVPKLGEFGLKLQSGKLPLVTVKHSSGSRAIVPTQRVRYLAEIAESVRSYHQHTETQSTIARERQSLRTAKKLFEGCGKQNKDFDELITWKDGEQDPKAKKLLDMWPDTVKAYSGDEYVVKIRDKEIRTQLVTESLSGTKIRKVILPKFADDGEVLRFLMKENVPGSFPFTAGVFAFKRENEDPTRMFAGEGDAFRTNRRFKRVSEGMAAKRLSTAFDSVTLYGCDPDERPDIYGKIGNSGVSIATLDDLTVLYDGFDLCAPTTSVSMTINGPAPIILACFFNTAMDQQFVKFKADNGREPTEDEAQKIREWVLANVRGTVQADILKEDQGQNTCIFSTEFALKMMGDIQEYFIEKGVENFYSVSISGYHIAEAGANPVSQLAFTLANGFTYVEYYLSRGMKIDDFARNFSFFFSSGMDPEYSVLGRVARRIWAVAMRDLYGADESSQRLKYHIQTSGRSLHSMEIQFNDIRTTLQALTALADNCNSLHTNAYDEAITTPTEESVRRAMAIQMIINREFGPSMNENQLQGSFFMDWLTDAVEEAVLQEFERISERRGVLGAMETQYQRAKIQDESLHYEHLKHSGRLPIIGVNTFENPDASRADYTPAGGCIALTRASFEEKLAQLNNCRRFQKQHARQAEAALKKLKATSLGGGNIFAELMETVRVASLGQISHALYEVGGRYRRNM
ncbi:MAG TPA: methylmalonyl-CoA mutase family protein, partial [Deltaproteobacteria bacterium]|nr:methylmalonyl-CoA mutase family protein [Deltaproteobacteria bacterium]